MYNESKRTSITMNTRKDEPTKRASPDGTHVRVEEVIEDLIVVVLLHHRVHGEHAERHQQE